MVKRTTLEDYDRRILAVQQLIEQRLDEELDPADLAKAAHFSLHHFHRIFRARLGESVMQYVRRLRLERAARRMRVSNERLLAFAVEAGYESHEAFTRAFIERFEVSPSEYRASPSLRLAEWQARRNDAPTAAVSVRTLPSVRVAFMRHRGGYQTIEGFWAKMRTWLSARGLEGRALYGVCPDDPEVTAEEHLRFDACVEVDPSFVAEGEVGIAELPAGTYAVGLHVGPYRRLSDTYLDVIGRWFPNNGYDLAPAPVIEHYVSDPATVEEAALQTEVRVRIAD